MDGADLAYAGAARQARLVRDREASAREVVAATLERIGRVGPALNAFRVVFAERALAEAEQADARRGAGDERPLLGVPVAVKDDADVAGEATTYGTSANGRPAGRDSEVVARLRAAGAIVVGKTNVPELTMWPFTETLSYGATRNPWSLDHTPGGSSGGSGAAVASGLCGVALGSDGAGSIRIPSAFCGVFGIKPQRGRIPLGPGRTEAWHGLVHLGPLARHVADAALFLDVAAGAEGFTRAAATPPGPLRVAVSTTVPPGALGRLGADQRRALDETAAVLRALGHDVADRPLEFTPTAGADVVARFLRGIHDEAAALAHRERLEPRTRSMARLGALVAPAAVARLRAAEPALRARVDAVFAHADVVLTPGPSGPPFRIGRFQRRGALVTLNASAAKVPWYGIFNATGQPAASVPAGFDGGGLPLAVQLVGRAGDEATLLSLAAQLEAERPWAERRPPVG